MFDSIATLFRKGEKVDRPLVWVSALMQNNTLFKELSPHTQRELQSSMQKICTENSHRGYLAALLLRKMEKSNDE